MTTQKDSAEVTTPLAEIRERQQELDRCIAKSGGSYTVAGSPITALSGRETDAAVAERVMGWTLVDNSGAAGGRYWQGHGGSFGDIGEYDLPHFSTDIAAAMEAVERLAADGWEADMYATEAGGRFAGCRFMRSRMHVEGVQWAAEEWGWGEGWTRSYSQALATAICRAALATVNVTAQEMESDQPKT